MRMKNLLFAALFVVAPAVATAQPAPAAPLPCVANGPVRFVCGQGGPEDLVEVPGSRWLIASAFGQGGGLFLIDTRASSSTKLFPAASATEKHDRKTYDTCPGPLQGADRER